MKKFWFQPLEYFDHTGDGRDHRALTKAKLTLARWMKWV
jgi:hypothetical protein